MALKPEEVKKINDLYKQLDQKDFEISMLRNELTTATTTVNYLNTVIEDNKTLFAQLTEKCDKILSLVSDSTCSKKTATKK